MSDAAITHDPEQFQKDLNKEALASGAQNPGPVARTSTDDDNTGKFHPMELPANPAARAMVPDHLIDKSPNAPWTTSPQGGSDLSNEERLAAAMEARSQFTQPEPLDYEKPHLEAGQAFLDAKAQKEADAATSPAGQLPAAETASSTSEEPSWVTPENATEPGETAEPDVTSVSSVEAPVMVTAPQEGGGSSSS
jgi:hypothetical protein